MTSKGFKLVSGGTDNHLVLVDLTPTGPGRGMFLDLALERIGLYANRNMVPKDPSSPFYPSGLRLGSPAATTRGMGTDEMKLVADLISRVAEHIKDVQLPGDKEARLALIKDFKANLKSNGFCQPLQQEVTEMCRKFPVPGEDSSA